MESRKQLIKGIIIIAIILLSGVSLLFGCSDEGKTKIYRIKVNQIKEDIFANGSAVEFHKKFGYFQSHDWLYSICV